jgi:hypothetical protein
LEKDSSDNPKNQGEDEPANGEHGVVGSYFLGTSVAASTVGNEDGNASKKGDTSHSKNKFLGPRVGVLGPRGHLALFGQGSGGVENRERG